MSDYTTVSIPKELHEKVEELIDNTGFSSVGEFTKFVLRDIAASGSLEKEPTEKKKQDVKERLRNLGYL